MAVIPDTGGKDQPAPRVVYFGMSGPLSSLPFAALLRAGITVPAVVIPAPPERRAAGESVRVLPAPTATSRPVLPLAFTSRTIVALAQEREIPVLEVARPGDQATIAALRAYAPDFIAVSCFPLKLPRRLRAVPRLGCLNVHPSLLPENRGPAPLFWTFRLGAERTGVTVHLMDDGLDSGPIVLQEGFALPDGLTLAELELRCASLAAELLPHAIHSLAAGTLTPRAQDETRATSHPWPAAHDFLLTPNQPARRLFNIIRGAAGWGFPFQIVLDGRASTIRAALAYDPTARLDAPAIREGKAMLVRCTPGVLILGVED